MHWLSVCAFPHMYVYVPTRVFVCEHSGDETGASPGRVRRKELEGKLLQGG